MSVRELFRSGFYIGPMTYEESIKIQQLFFKNDIPMKLSSGGTSFNACGVIYIYMLPVEKNHFIDMSFGDRNHFINMASKKTFPENLPNISFKNLCQVLRTIVRASTRTINKNITKETKLLRISNNLFEIDSSIYRIDFDLHSRDSCRAILLFRNAVLKIEDFYDDFTQCNNEITLWKAIKKTKYKKYFAEMIRFNDSDRWFLQKHCWRY